MVKKRLNFNEDATFESTAAFYRYEEAYQNGLQYGNLTHVVEAAFDGSQYQDYRISWTAYYPKVTSTTYIVGLPAYSNSYQCALSTTDGDCYSELNALMNETGDYGSEYLTGSTQYYYDANATFAAAPTAGKLTWQRAFACFANSSNVCYEAYDEDWAKQLYSDTKFEYDAWGNTTRITRYRGYGTATGFATGQPEVTQNCYEAFNWSTGGCTAGTYHTYLTGTTVDYGGLNHRTRIDYDYDFGVPILEKDANNVDTEAAYDPFGRLVKVERYGDDLASDPTIQVSYPPVGWTYSTSNPFYTIVEQKVDASHTYTVRKYYNGLGQLLQSQVGNASVLGATQDIVVDYQYDSLGRLIKQTPPRAATAGAAGVKQAEIRYMPWG